MGAFARWYLVVAALGVLVLPLASRLFRDLPDRGYCFGKILAILLVGFTLWTGTAYGFLRNDLGGAVLAAAIVALASALAGWSALAAPGRGLRPLLAALRRRLPLIVGAEALFLLAFGGWALVRAHLPAAHHTEQPMDLLLLTGIWSAPSFPPQDPWLAGYAISYYYFGYWLLATLARLAGVPPEIAYNLGQACWFGLLLLGSFGVGFNLAALARREGETAAPALGGLLAVLAVALVGNLQGTLDALRVALDGGRTDWWWWRSSRVIADRDPGGRPVEVIDEFPFFSYLLGDNHPHLLAMPFLVLIVALALSLWLARSPGGSARRASWAGADQGFPGGLAGLAVTVIAAGSFVVLNAWDLVSAWGVLALTAAVARWRPFLLLLALSAGGAIAYIPYLLSAQSQVSGFVPNLLNPTALDQLARMFGILAPGLVALVWLASSRRRPDRRLVGASFAGGLALCALWLAGSALWAGQDGSGAAAGGGAGAALALERWASNGATLVLLVMALALVVGSIRSGSELSFALLLTAVGLGLLVVPELGYLRDTFGTRMNTVFKLYYQAWLLLALGASHGTLLALRARGPARAAALASLVLLGTGLVFPVASLSSRLRAGPVNPPTLDALAYLQATDPDELAAIRWVRAHTRPGARVLQAVGESYNPADDRISVATGRATLLGWEGHELQWRGSAFAAQAAGRAGAVRDIYRDAAADALAPLLRTWRIDYVYVGPRERARYEITPASEARLAQVMDLAFQQGSARIYRRRG